MSQLKIWLLFLQFSKPNLDKSAPVIHNSVPWRDKSGLTRFPANESPRRTGLRSSLSTKSGFTSLYLKSPVHVVPPPANRWQKLGLVWKNRKKISQIFNDYLCLPLFLLFILCLSVYCTAWKLVGVVVVAFTWFICILTIYTFSTARAFTLFLAGALFYSACSS